MGSEPVQLTGGAGLVDIFQFLPFLITLTHTLVVKAALGKFENSQNLQWARRKHVDQFLYWTLGLTQNRYEFKI